MEKPAQQPEAPGAFRGLGAGEEMALFRLSLGFCRSFDLHGEDHLHGLFPPFPFFRLGSKVGMRDLLKNARSHK